MTGILGFVGLGLGKGDITLKGLEFLRKCSIIYFDTYTSLSSEINQAYLEELTGKKVKPVNREFLETEKRKEIYQRCLKGENVVIACIGNPFFATTHVALRIEAEKLGIKTEVFNSFSILDGILSATGLEPYKLGKIVTIVYPEPEYGYFPTTPYKVLQENLARGLHTIFLLDLKLEKKLAMTIPEAIELLTSMEKQFNEGVITEATIGIGLARVGTSTQVVKAGKLRKLEKMDFGEPPHTLVIPGTLDPVEREALKILGNIEDEAITEWLQRLKEKPKNT
ncbi:MAG: diphthine synthase [Thermoprotei archaeon]|nr:MAG: diphthine synthase [Thermoprotei archaeon]